MKGTKRELPDTIGGRIQKLRVRANFTQADLARSMGVKRETVNQWESGTRDLKTEATIKLANLFGVTCDELLRGIKSDYIDIHEQTGLSNEAIDELTKNYLKQNQEISISSAIIPYKILNNLLTLKLFNKILYEIADLLMAAENNEVYKEHIAESSLTMQTGIEIYDKLKKSYSLNLGESIELDPTDYYRFQFIKTEEDLSLLLKELVESHLKSMRIEDIKSRIESYENVERVLQEQHEKERKLYEYLDENNLHI